MEIANNNVTFAPAIIEVAGRTKTERQLSVVNSASTQCKLALANAKGKVGQAARSGIAFTGLKSIAQAAAKANYRPVAEYFAARMGQPMVITNRASFEALPDVFEGMVMKAKLSKTGGYTTDKKTGALKPAAALALAMELKAIATELVSEVNGIVAEEREARKALATA